MKITGSEIQMVLPDDFHVHLRTGDLLKKVVGYTARQFEYTLVMPNTAPHPILFGATAQDYREDILLAVDKQRTPYWERFRPLTAIKLLETTTPETIEQAARYGVIAAKVYPCGVTTNSEDGIMEFNRLNEVFAIMQKMGIVLCLHGQRPESFILDREKDFLTTLVKIATDFPSLRIVLEHVSTREAITAVQMLPKNVAATITAHHLVLTLDDVIGSKLNPHVFCQPVAQRPEDRDAVLAAAFSGNPKFFFGSDSAPHPRQNKESEHSPPGVFSAPVLLPFLVGIFVRYDKLARLEPFVSQFGSEFYGLKKSGQTISLRWKKWTVPYEIDGLVPFQAGEELNWKVMD